MLEQSWFQGSVYLFLIFFLTGMPYITAEKQVTSYRLITISITSYLIYTAKSRQWQYFLCPYWCNIIILSSCVVRKRQANFIKPYSILLENSYSGLGIVYGFSLAWLNLIWIRIVLAVCTWWKFSISTNIFVKERLRKKLHACNIYAISYTQTNYNQLICIQIHAK